MKRMNRAVGFVGWALLASLLLAGALVIAAVWAAGGIDSAVIRVDGESVQLAELGLGHGLVALVGIALVLLVVALVLPLAVLIPLALVALVLVALLLVAAGVLAMLFSPLILLGLVVWFAVRATRRSGPGASVRPAGGATIAG